MNMIPELLIHTFCYLPYRDLLQVQQVCKFWHLLTQQEQIFAALVYGELAFPKQIILPQLPFADKRATTYQILFHLLRAPASLVVYKNAFTDMNALKMLIEKFGPFKEEVETSKFEICSNKPLIQCLQIQAQDFVEYHSGILCPKLEAQMQSKPGICIDAKNWSTVATPALQQQCAQIQFCTYLYNDEDHNFDEVISQIRKAIACDYMEAVRIAYRAHNEQRTVCFVGDLANACRVAQILATLTLQVAVEQYALSALEMLRQCMTTTKALPQQNQQEPVKDDAKYEIQLFRDDVHSPRDAFNEIAEICRLDEQTCLTAIVSAFRFGYHGIVKVGTRQEVDHYAAKLNAKLYNVVVRLHVEMEPEEEDMFVMEQQQQDEDDVEMTDSQEEEN